MPSSSSEPAPTAARGPWTGSSPKPWRLNHTGTSLLLELDGPARQLEHVADAITVRSGWFRRRVEVDLGDRRVTLKPIKRADAKALDSAVRVVRSRRAANADLAAIARWHDWMRATIDSAVGTGRWIPEETIAAIEHARPVAQHGGLATNAIDPELAAVLSEAEINSLRGFHADLRAWVAQVNEQILASELVARKAFLDRIESSPLTAEQSRAVLCFDNRVQVVASAGSGKTSVMVARAAYAIERGFVHPSRILLLAFNKNAAEELQERIDSRLEAAGISSAGVRASTFHSFGLSLIGQATGRKPRLASWLDAGGDLQMIERIVDDLRDSSTTFRFGWDIFRRLYGPLGEEQTDDEPDGWDKETRQTGYRTANGGIVKSHGERLIADWLYLNHVDYEYEREYSVDVATADHSQYKPDFYYPVADVWHEHWGIDLDGNAPSNFHGYADSMRWKKELHRREGTTLIETTWGEIQSPETLTRLAAELRAAGLELNWDPDRPSQGPAPMRHEDLARLVRTFMAHVKSNGLTRESVEARRSGSRPGLQRPRSRIFLDLYWRIHEEWQRRLAAENEVDFEDMLVMAAEHLESGRAPRDYDLVLVDEFQDASQARARLVAALVNAPGRHLLTVGDDWQAINRFAGADISVMSSFERWFGRSRQLRLETTFRCSAQICAVSSHFVAKNPAQLPKLVRAFDPTTRSRPTVVSVPSRDGIAGAVESILQGLSESVGSGTLASRPGKPFTVFILGRYRFDQDLAPRSKYPHLKIEFKTIHSSKGLEADHVIVPNLTRGNYGFPSTITDDPVLELVMPTPEEFDHAEERRLFYVALTRARLGATLVAVDGQESPFVVELLTDALVDLDSSRVPTPAVVCPTCREGTLVARTGRFGEFYGCTNFPRCRHTQNAMPPRSHAATSNTHNPAF